MGGGGLGIIGLVIGLIVAFTGGGGTADILSQLNSLNGLNGQQAGASGTSGKVVTECRTGADADKTQDCRVVGYVNSIQAYWKQALRGYTVVPTVFNTCDTRPPTTGRVSGFCGDASARSTDRTA